MNTRKECRPLSPASRIAAKERRLENARRFNLLDDIFMSVALQDKAACQYVLQVLTEIQGLSVHEVRPQYRIARLASHDAILDILAEDQNGALYNIEIQRSDTIDHARRTRFYASMIDSEYLNKGETYAQLPEVYIIYISETDLWHAGRTEYPVRKTFGSTGLAYQDGQHILYVNAAVDDGSEKARLMQYFKTSNPEDTTHGPLSARVRYLKSQGGKEQMRSVSQEIFQEGREDGIRESELRFVQKLMQNLHCTAEQAMQFLEIPEKDRQLLQKNNLQ